MNDSNEDSTEEIRRFAALIVVIVGTLLSLIYFFERWALHSFTSALNGFIVLFFVNAVIATCIANRVFIGRYIYGSIWVIVLFGMVKNADQQRRYQKYVTGLTKLDWITPDQRDKGWEETRRAFIAAYEEVHSWDEKGNQKLKADLPTRSDAEDAWDEYVKHSADKDGPKWPKRPPLDPRWKDPFGYMPTVKDRAAFRLTDKEVWDVLNSKEEAEHEKFLLEIGWYGEGVKTIEGVRSAKLKETWDWVNGDREDRRKLLARLQQTETPELTREQEEQIKDDRERRLRGE